MAQNSTTFASMLKETYTKEVIRDLTLKNQPFLNMLTKTEKGVAGQDYKIPMIVTQNTRRSCDFPTAQAAPDNVGYYAFALTLAQDFCLATWTGKVVRQTQGDSEAFDAIVDAEMQRSVRALNRSLGIKLFRTGTGSVTQIATTAVVASTKLQLLNPSDGLHFDVGDQVVFSAADGGALRGGNAVTVTQVDRTNGILTAAANWNASQTLIATSDYAYKLGDAQNGTGTNVAPEGLLSYGPASTVALTNSFYGVVRSVDQQRLAFVLYDNTLKQDGIDEVLVNAVSAVMANGSPDPDAIIINPVKFRALVNSLSSKIMRPTDSQDEASIGFGGIRLLTDIGAIKVYSDINCPEPNAFVLQMDTLELISAGPAIGVLEQDGIEALRVYNADSYEYRMGGYMQLACHAPGWNCTVIL